MGICGSSQVGPSPLDLDRSGEKLIAALDPEERKYLMEQAEKNNKFKTTSGHTRFWIKLANMLINPEKPASPQDVRPNWLEPRNWETYDMPVGGARFIKEDEDDMQDGGSEYVKWAKATARTILVGATTELPLEECRDLIEYFESDEEAVLCANETFGRTLPKQFNTWEHMDRDDVMCQIIIAGVGQSYLAGPSETKGRRVVPPGTVIECNVDIIGRYETRKPFSRYGATAFLGPKEGGDGTKLHELVLLGIYTSEHHKTVYPENVEWKHAKALFRSSLGSDLTLRRHLTNLHWIIANGLSHASRVALSPASPLRRLLKPHYFHTTAINSASIGTLFPIDALAFRSFGFTEKSWVKYFKDAFAEWEYATFPERMETSGIPKELMEQMPLYQDGLLLWQTQRNYVMEYLQLYYPDDGMITSDADIQAFWDHFQTKQLKKPWKLPTLTRDALGDLLAELIWNVTGNHEMIGSIVEYLTVPNGLATKLVPNKDEADIQSFAQALIIITLTGFRQPPLMGDWTHLFEEKAFPIVRKFQDELEKVQVTLDERNEVRDTTEGMKKFVCMCPKILESSVST